MDAILIYDYGEITAYTDGKGTAEYYVTNLRQASDSIVKDYYTCDSFDSLTTGVFKNNMTYWRKGKIIEIIRIM